MPGEQIKHGNQEFGSEEVNRQQVQRSQPSKEELDAIRVSAISKLP